MPRWDCVSTSQQNNMAKHEEKYCPRCNAAFECRVGNITQCQCYGIIFTEQQKIHIAALYSDCLCASCLQELKQGFDAKDLPLPKT